MRDPLALVLIIGGIAFGCWAIGRSFFDGDHSEW
jgi:hypothetical protein